MDGAYIAFAVGCAARFAYVVAGRRASLLSPSAAPRVGWPAPPAAEPVGGGSGGCTDCRPGCPCAPAPSTQVAAAPITQDLPQQELAARRAQWLAKHPNSPSRPIPTRGTEPAF